MEASNSSDVNAYLLRNSPLHQALVLVFFAPLVVTIIIGNALVILSVWRESILKSPRYFLLCSLALSDFCNGIIATPLELFSRTVQNEITCSRAKSAYFSIWPYMFIVVSILHLILVTVDRHLAITRPLRYVTMVTTSRVLVVIFIVWMFGIGYGVASLINAFTDDDDSTTQLCTGVRYTDSSTRQFFIATGVTLLLLSLTLLILNLRILGIARRQCQRISSMHVAVQPRDNPRPVKTEKNSQFKASCTIVLVVGTFFVCWLPTSMWYICRTLIDIPHVCQIAFIGITFFFTNLSSALNPFIYCYKDRSFKRAFCKIIPKLEKYLFPKNEFHSISNNESKITVETIM